jgi:hypothetical protein
MHRKRSTNEVQRNVPASNHKVVLDPKNAIALLLQPFVADGVAAFLVFTLMRAAVKFYDQAMLEA